jgi:rhodanese-related sulfurtransferase
MRKNKFSILSILMATILIFILIFTGSCKEISAIEKEGISTTVELEKDLKEQVEESVSNEKENTLEIISISPAEVYEIINNYEDYIIIDVRTQDEYNDGHLEKALLISVDVLEDVVDTLPKDKPIIVYCQGGVRSRKAAEILVNNEFNQVYDMGGILDWIEEGFPIVVEEGAVSAILFISVDEAYKVFLEDNDYLFIDVRTEDEYKSGHIEGALHIPVTEFEERLDEIPKDRPIIVYCNGSSCERSGYAAGILKENYYREVYDMVGGGIFEWLEKGYPIVEEE